MEFPIERPLPDRHRGGVPKGKPGYTNMLCPTDNKLTQWEFLEGDRLRCTQCQRREKREDVV